MSAPTAPVPSWQPPARAAPLPPVLECEGCGRRYRRPALARGDRATCTRCGELLARGTALPLDGQLALASTSLIVFLIAMFAPIAEIELGGARTQATLLDAIRVTWEAGQPLLALLTLFTACLFPLGVILLLGFVLAAQFAGRGAPDLVRAARALRWLMRWSMAEVLLLAGLVAWSRSNDVAIARVGPGLVAFGALSLIFTACESAAAESLRPPPEPRMPLEEGVQRSAAFLLTAAVLYLPSSLLPVTTAGDLPSGTHAYTLFGGVLELWRVGLWDLAVIVFVASLVVPLVKMVLLALLLTTARRRSRWRQRERAAMARLVAGVGHWSMLDVYVVVLLTAMVSFGVLAGVQPEPGLVAFGAVVVFTMLAAESFDPRWIWPDEGEGGDG
jgi:paraquat-inducible protein A